MKIADNEGFVFTVGLRDFGYGSCFLKDSNLPSRTTIKKVFWFFIITRGCCKCCVFLMDPMSVFYLAIVINKVINVNYD